MAAAGPCVARVARPARGRSDCRGRRAALAQARTERTAAILLDQYHGALRRALDAIDAHCRMAFTVQDGRSETTSCENVETLLARVPLGLHLTQPWRVVLAGRPNVGKSSLMNALAGFQRRSYITSPGTTRDVVTVTTAIDGWPVELCDTAGLHAAGSAVEQAGVARAREALAAADLVLLVFDRSRPWCEADQELLDAVGTAGAARRSSVLHNKSDLPPASDRGRRACCSAHSAATA